MTSKENYNEPIYENLRFFKGLELVYRHPCIHLRTENKECGNCKYGLNNNCVIHNEYLKIKKDLEVLEILKEVIKNNVFDVAMLDDRPNGETLLSCEDFGITLKTEDYYKIREWLDE